MEIITALKGLNYLAVLVAAIIQFGLGALWYSPLMFAKSWIEDNHFNREGMKKGDMRIQFTTSFILCFISSATLGVLLFSAASLSDAVNWSVFISLGLVAALMGVHYLYEQKSLRLFIINASYNVFGLILAAIILVLWK